MVKNSDRDAMPLTFDDIGNNLIISSNELSFDKIMIYLIFIYSIDN